MFSKERVIDVTPKRKLGSLSNDDCDGNENGNENGFRLAKQQLCTCITLFVHFFVVVARLQSESA